MWIRKRNRHRENGALTNSKNIPLPKKKTEKQIRVNKNPPY